MIPCTLHPILTTDRNTMNDQQLAETYQRRANVALDSHPAGLRAVYAAGQADTPTPDLDGLTPEEAYAKLAQTAIDNGNARTRHEYALNLLVLRARETGYQARMQEEQDRAEAPATTATAADPRPDIISMSTDRLRDYIDSLTVLEYGRLRQDIRHMEDRAQAQYNAATGIASRLDTIAATATGLTNPGGE